MLQPATDRSLEARLRGALHEVGLADPADVRVQEDDYGPYAVAEIDLSNLQLRLDYDRGIFCLDLRARPGNPWIPFHKALRALGAPEAGRCTEDLTALFTELAHVVSRLAPRLQGPTFAAEADPALRPKQIS